MHAHTLAHSNTKHCDGFHRKIGCGLTHLKQIAMHYYYSRVAVCGEPVAHTWRKT